MIKQFLGFVILCLLGSSPLMALHGRHLEKHRGGMASAFLGDVTVGGFVKRPGPVHFLGNMTLGDAIDAVGGATPFGSTRRVQLHRNGKRFVYDLKNPEHLKVRLFPRDVINVPQKVWLGR